MPPPEFIGAHGFAMRARMPTFFLTDFGSFPHLLAFNNLRGHIRSRRYDFVLKGLQGEDDSVFFFLQNSALSIHFYFVEEKKDTQGLVDIE